MSVGTVQAPTSDVASDSENESPLKELPPIVSDLRQSVIQRRYTNVRIKGFLDDGTEYWFRIRLQSLTAREAMIPSNFVGTGDHHYVSIALCQVDEDNHRTHTVDDPSTWEYLRTIDSRVFAQIVDAINEFTATPTPEELMGN